MIYSLLMSITIGIVIWHMHIHIGLHISRAKKLTKDEHALQTFFHNIRTKIRGKCAFLLHELLNDFASISEEAGLQIPVIEVTRTLKRRIEDEFGSDISFKPTSIFLYFHLTPTLATMPLLYFMVVDSETMI